jgi:hypothetical protein
MRVIIPPTIVCGYYSVLMHYIFSVSSDIGIHVAPY